VVAHCDKKKRLAPLLGCLRNLDEAGMSSHVHVQIFESFVNFSFGTLFAFFMFENLGCCGTSGLGTMLMC